MTPSAYLAQLRHLAQGGAGASRVYSALTTGASAETFLTLHSKDGLVQSLPYNGILFIEGDGRGGTRVELILARMAVALHGRTLAPVYEAIRTRTAAHIHEFNEDAHDAPEPGEPVITRLDFAVGQAKPNRQGLPN